MSFNAERLYELLPAVYRLRDAEQGEPLRALLAVISEQAEVLEADLDQLYDDQFIETCAEWVTAYLGDLVGYRLLHGVSPRISSPRADVANTIGFRRRKGTAAVLEQLAHDVSGWDARVVEFFQLLATTQFMNHIRPSNAYAPDLRDWELLERLGTPFDRMAHTVDVRRIATDGGRYNIPNVGVALWRLKANRLTKSPAVRIDDRRYLFSPLGNNTPLFTRPRTEDQISHLAKPINVPEPISRRVLHASLEDPERDQYVGAELSMLLAVDGVDLTSSEIKACNLSDIDASSDWAHMPEAGDRIAVDPVLGRIAFPEGLIPTRVETTFHYGFSADLGGGEYERRSTFSNPLPPDRTVSTGDLIQPAVEDLSHGGVLQIQDSGRYAETPFIRVQAGKRFELRAANEHRPTIVIDSDLRIAGAGDSEVSLNGLLVIGGRIVVPASGENKLRRLTLRHCTLVPGLSIDIDGQPVAPGQPSLVVEIDGVTVELDHCIVGSLRIAEDARIRIADSIVDANANDGLALAGPDGTACGPLTMEASTVIGRVHAIEMELVSNSILLAAPQPGDSSTSAVRSIRRQSGCVRFSYLPRDSRVPRRHRTQPDLALRTVISRATQEQGPLSQPQRDRIAAEIDARIRPVFSDQRYGQPDYIQLDRATPDEIRRGADDESEMGALHQLFAPQRETNVNVRLEEYLRFGLEAGIYFET